MLNSLEIGISTEYRLDTHTLYLFPSLSDCIPSLFVVLVHVSIMQLFQRFKTMLVPK